MFFLLPEPDLRVSDSERDAAVDFLNRHYAAGRLSDDELSARIDAVYRARFDSQLEALTDDLPGLMPEAHRRTRRPLGAAVAAAAAVVGVIALMSVVPPEGFATLIALGLPLLMMLLFTVAPLAVPVLAFLWLARSLDGGPRPRELPPRRF
jgi:uncharacterized membrane protein